MEWRLPALFIASALSMIGALFYTLLALPFEATQGPVQKIFYFHVPSAFAMYFFAFLGVVFSVVYLKTREPGFDVRAQSAMRTSLLFGTLVIVSGPLWAKPIWGVYWTWDPRLTLAFIVFLLLIAYVFTRSFLKDRQMEDRGALVGAILAALSIPFMLLTHLSVKIWRGLHPSVLNNPQGLDANFSNGLQAMIVAVFLLGLCLFLIQSRSLELEKKIEDLERKAGL